MPGRFWLTVGTLEPRKNQVRLLRAYARLRSKLGSSLRLVIVGGEGWLMEEFRSTVSELEIQDHVLLPGYLDDQGLVWLYQNSFCFLYPSLFEGFGLPLVEAMELGAPVISSNSGAMPEIVGSAGLLVDPYSEDEICDAMERVASGQVRREVLRERSLQRVREFTWSTAANSVSNLYHQVLAMPHIFDPEPAGYMS